MRRHNVAVGLVGIAVLLAACGKGGGDLPLLPGAQNAGATGERSMAAGAADTSMMVANVRYELGDGVSTDAKQADAYDFADTTKGEVAKLAKALGVGGDVRNDGGNFTIGGGEGDKPSLYVSSSGGVFSMTVGYGVSSAGSGSSGCAVAPAPADEPDPAIAVDPAPSCEPAPTTSTTIAPDAPTAAEAKRVATEALEAGGVDLRDAKLSVESFDGSTQNVRFQHRVAGEVIDGYESFVTVGPKNAILSASGYLVAPTSVGTYELATLARAVERLNDSYGKATTLEGPAVAGVAAQDDVAVAPVPPDGGGTPTSSEPRVIKLTSVSVGLMMQSDDSGRLWLVPAYRFGTEDRDTVVAAAADDKYIQQPTTTTAPKLGDGGGSSKPGQTDPAGPEASCTALDGELSGQVCVTAARADQPVTFRITATDDDRGFATGCFDGVTADYGDGGAGEVRCEACSTDVPDGPGKLAVERTHTYAQPGTYTVSFTIRSGADCGQANPHDSSAKAQLTIKVA